MSLKGALLVWSENESVSLARWCASSTWRVSAPQETRAQSKTSRKIIMVIWFPELLLHFTSILVHAPPWIWPCSFFGCTAPTFLSNCFRSFLFLFTLESFFLLLIIPFYRTLGKIQGDSRKFLDLFKSYFGSQISSHSQSLNEVHIFWLQPKSATKFEFFSYIFVFDCQFESAHVALWRLT